MGAPVPSLGEEGIDEVTEAETEALEASPEATELLMVAVKCLLLYAVLSQYF